MSDFITFKEDFKTQHIFTKNDILVRYGKFYMKNLHYWQKKGLVLKLRNEFYCFPELLKLRMANMFICHKLYSPCYISMQTALEYYNMIPDTVVVSFGITTGKTKSLSNTFGDFHYFNIKKALFFGYVLEEIHPVMFIYLAEKEKALLDYLYLGKWIPATKNGILSERFDEDEINNLNWDRLYEYMEKFDSIKLSNKVKLVKKYLC